jgi:hypothetical protein
MAKRYARRGGERRSGLRARMQGRTAMDLKRAEKQKELEDKVDEANKKQL